MCYKIMLKLPFLPNGLPFFSSFFCKNYFEKIAFLRADRVHFKLSESRHLPLGLASVSLPPLWPLPSSFYQPVTTVM
uniref:Uncharacterized protein n=1 Tax=Rhizophora mucronata TaxID=61149 RepID=A0A2P2II15_RHIMU